ncbi:MULTISPECIES: pyruvate dehydrogenase (acetyl-transferring) E1 component subunit alpha [Arthrobacter]|uniref:Pyruvate dehydrogenase (Acetyl-transferring) E1 component subunit alpha n=1 Tax=Arthrobacter caoxuetaonis TaxID=2886935 RepID=A0A9X1MFC0_9MICC|nr:MULTISPECIES: pyruvate dehydrogenase (acetyl-transferring) E1 component subunit alpha [Arthrobacter]MCC3281893.1 pyruvate dehydrogenase (acetyl-transferring) E1 component subunit alpha [Arthrobacter caoxuetaonis]MCC3283068.1 pyruvate dehydrogenase (acetyl-transferring) E1 component subunit alpha [Arthrobacter caoxuetaonis]MCC3298185.1 pyruvate dehydrogenase (acetyl-transferring) E1 component subunit alpha [Arthrobacter caoxuetaonis]MCC9194664.1 pyruvate dehydrogenase (acetyl-transferring) E1
MALEHLPASEFDSAELDETLMRAAGSAPEGMVQLLTPDGERVGHQLYEQYALDVDAEVLRSFYRDMFLIRRFDIEATALQRQGELVMWVPLTGQEGAQIGSGRALAAQDYVFPTYREHGVALTRGLELSHLLRRFRGISHGGWDPRESNFHLYTLVLAAQVPHAVGYAMGMARDQAADPSVPAGATVAYFGDGASSEGDVHEAMVFAASYDAPVVFFCQNNHWAISVPTEVQSRIPLANRAQGYGFPGIRVDGNDVLAVHAVTRWALEHARSGKGPVLIEAFTYRMSAHTTADDPTKYRLSADEQAWTTRDPLLRLEKYLRSSGGGDDAFFAALAAEGDELAAKLRADVQAMEPPVFEDSFTDVYADPHPLIREELAFHQAYEDGFADDDEEDAEEAGE